MESNTFGLQLQEDQKLRDGRYGPVFLAMRLDTGVFIAAERLDLDEFGEAAVLKSVASQLGQQQLLPEQPVVSYIGHQRRDGHSYLLTEHMPGGTLEDFLVRGVGKNGVQPSMAASILRQVVGALEQLQKRGLAVAFVDSKHVLLDSQGNVKLDGPFFCDRGVTGEALPPTCLTVPEVVFGQGMSMRKADVWLLGILATRLLSGKQDAISGRVSSIAAQLQQDQKSPPMETPAVSRAQTQAPEEGEASKGRIPMYGGDPTKYREWKQKAQLHLFKAHQKGDSEADKVATLLEALEGGAFVTVTRGDVDNCVDLETGQARITTLNVFERLEARYGGVISPDEAMAKLQVLRQGSKSHEDYTCEFESLWAIAGIERPEAKRRMYYQCLAFGVRSQLDAIGFRPQMHEFDMLWEITNKASKFAKKKDDDKRGSNNRGRGGGRGGGNARGRGAQAGNEEGETRTCFYCDKVGHVMADCRKWAADKKNGKLSTKEDSGRDRGRGGVFDLLVPDKVKSLPDSDLALDFLRQCFTINIDERPSISELKDHPFLASPAA